MQNTWPLSLVTIDRHVGAAKGFAFELAIGEPDVGANLETVIETIGSRKDYKVRRRFLRTDDRVDFISGSASQHRTVVPDRFVANALEQPGVLGARLPSSLRYGREAPKLMMR